MSPKPLTYEQYSQLKERKELLERVINSYTIYSWFDPPLKTPEEIEAMKDLWKAEIKFIDPILKKYKDKMIGLAMMEEYSKGEE